MHESHRSLLAYHPRFLEYDFGPQHPLRPERISAGLDLLEASGIWDPNSETLTPEPARVEELELVHSPDFIRAVAEGGTGWLPSAELARYGLTSGDNPPFAGMHEASSFVTGGSVEAIRAILDGRIDHAFNPAGGLHHAMPARASGFCIYNDPAVAAAVARKEYSAKVLYIDFDCHHGDGVQWIFYDDPDVMTVSFHESGRFLFPGTGGVEEIGKGRGRGFSINVPLAPFTTDASWLEAIQAIVPPISDRFKPDVIISSHGADTHVWDPLTHLAVTTRSFAEQARLTHQIAHTYCEGRWLAVGSGGYDWRRVVPRSWSILWSEMTKRELHAELPGSWVRRWDTDPGEPLPKTFADDPAVGVPIDRADEVILINRETVAAVQRAAFPSSTL